MEASTFLDSDRSLARQEDASLTGASEQTVSSTSKPAIDLPQLPETTPRFLSLSHCRTAVHALKALELALEEARLAVVAPQVRATSTVTPYILDLGALLFGKRQLSEIRHLLETFGGRLKGILATSVVTTQAAYGLGIILLEAQPEEEPSEENGLDATQETASSGAVASLSSPHQEGASRARQPLSKPSLPIFSRKELASQSLLRQGAIGTEAAAVSTLSTLYVKSTLRSGRFVDYDGHVVLLGDAHPGSEIRATGDILVWGALRGLAHAGQKGNRKAEIRALRLDALQLRIADLIARRPDQWSSAPGSISSPEPSGSQPAANLGELARVLDGEIQIVSAYATLEGTAG